MEIIKILILLFVVGSVGWSILYLVSSKNASMCFLERIFISYGFGFGFISLEMLCFHFFNIKFDLFTIIASWAPLFMANLFIRLKTGRKLRPVSYGAKNKENAGAFINFFLAAGILFETVYAFFRALIRPIEAYDAVATYAIRSKIFYLSKSIPHDFFYNLSQLFPHPDYPLAIPLSETLVYLFLETLNDQLVKLIFPLYFIAILGILYFAIRRFSSRSYALLFTFVLASIPQFNNFATNAYHDVPLAYYCFSGTLFLLCWFKETGSPAFLYISAVMTALSAWTKNEGFVYCAANVALLAIFMSVNRRHLSKKDILNGFLYTGIILLILAPWLYVKYAANLVNSDVGSTTLSQLNIIKQSYKIWPIFYEFQRQVFGPKKWNIIWIVFIISAVIYRKKIFTKEQLYISLSLMLIVSGYVLAYLIGRDNIWHMVGSTWSRMLIHFLPLAVYWLASLVKDEVKT